MDVPIHHEVPSGQTPTLLTIPVLVITESSSMYTTNILQSLQSFTPLPLLSTPTPPPTTEATNPQSALLDFASVFQFNNRVSALVKDVSELKKENPLKTQANALVDEHLDARLRATKDKFMSYLSATITARITKQTLLPTYDKVYSLNRSKKDKDKDEDHFARLDRGLKMRKITKDAESTKGLKSKDSNSDSSK
nr:hypothetical protein [Tanacetum cinerariifolium]